MTPEQQRFVDYATVEAAANGFAFELREPRDDREGAALTIKGRSSGYDTIGISPDGWVGLVSMSQSYDRDLSKFTKKLLAAGKKMRPKPEKKPKAKKPPARRCSSGGFKDSAIIRQIVDRLHVGTPEAEVLEYARSRLASGAWDKMSDKDRKAFECEVLKAHDRNRGTYRQVTGSRAHATRHATKTDPVKCVYTASIRLAGAPRPMQTREFKHRADAQAWLDQQREIADRRGWGGYKFELAEKCKIARKR
ncbi:MAG TPA: hypothetical protein VLE97_10965 [Gaiellaceae bacterium]|nr:hypothetical protein [Gaiellaceae bacterium]